MRQNDTQEVNSRLHEHSADIRVGRELLHATKPYVEESYVQSWWQVGPTFGLMIAALIAAGALPWWPLQLVFSLLGALLMVRAFITFHDYLHGAILKDSRVAYWLFHTYGAFVLTPTRSWSASHNYHHGHVGQISDASVGAFPLLTTRIWRASTRWQRLAYRAQRHPLVVVLSYPIVFGLNITLIPLIRSPDQHIDSLIALIVHFGLIGLLWWLGGVSLVFFVVLLPMFVASALGCYLFFAQHSFRRMQIASPEAWTYYRGGDGVFKFHADESGHAVVYRKHWLSPYPPSQRPNSVLSPSRGDGGHSGATVAIDHVPCPEGYRRLLSLCPLGRRQAAYGFLSGGSITAVTYR